jgi:hypothetical protein
MKIYLNGQVAHYKDLFPNVSFPASGPSDSFLESKGAKKVFEFLPHDRATQKLVRVKPYLDQGVCYTVEVQDKTEDEIAADLASKSAKLRADRDAALARSDWMVIKAQETGVALDSEWATYRQALRDLPDANGFPNVDLPLPPGVFAGNID